MGTDGGRKLAANGSKGLGIAALPSVGVALLPKLTCPVCWPAYTALLSSLGISFVDYTPYLLPTVAIFLAVALSALAYRAKARRGYGLVCCVGMMVFSDHASFHRFGTLVE